MASEKFCLNWNDFQKNIRSTFQEMRDDLDLADVTLACEDRRQFQAHKFVLSASSPFFKEILGNNRHPHPLIYLKGMKAVALESVLDFLYRGEVNVYQQDLNDFLALAEDLELKGLTGQQPIEDLRGHVEDNAANNESPLKPQKLWSPKKEIKLSKADAKFSLNTSENKHEFSNFEFSGQVVPVQDSVSVANNDELNNRIESLLEKIDGNWKCMMCDQKSTHKVTLKRHIESKHTTGGSHHCQVCGKIFRSSHTLNCHMSRMHRN